MTKIPLLVLILATLMINGCTPSGYVQQFNQETKKNDWEIIYRSSYKNYYWAVSLGHNTKNEILAIDCCNLMDNLSYRIYAEIDGQRIFNLNLFKYVGGTVIGSIPEERRKYWQDCQIEQLPQQKFFNKLPQDIRLKTQLVINAAAKEFNPRSRYFP